MTEQLLEKDKKMSFAKKKATLRSYWKWVKSGRLLLEDVPQPYYDLLLRYYPFQ